MHLRIKIALWSSTLVIALLITLFVADAYTYYDTVLLGSIDTDELIANESDSVMIMSSLQPLTFKGSVFGINY